MTRQSSEVAWLCDRPLEDVVYDIVSFPFELPGCDLGEDDVAHTLDVLRHDPCNATTRTLWDIVNPETLVPMYVHSTRPGPAALAAEGGLNLGCLIGVGAALDHTTAQLWRVAPEHHQHTILTSDDGKVRGMDKGQRTEVWDLDDEEYGWINELPLAVRALISNVQSLAYRRDNIFREENTAKVVVAFPSQHPAMHTVHNDNVWNCKLEDYVHVDYWPGNEVPDRIVAPARYVQGTFNLQLGNFIPNPGFGKTPLPTMSTYAEFWDQS